MILYAGDLHGNLEATKSLDAFATRWDVLAIVQVGDFGLRWEPDLLRPFFEERTSTIPWYTAGGNHEDWSTWKALEKDSDPEQPFVKLARSVNYVKRGAIAYIAGLRHLFCGGAESSDRHARVEGVDWWPEETPSREEFEAFALALDTIHLDVVVTHDAPLEVGTFRHGDRDVQPTGQALTRALELSARRPRFWAFGHHHNHGMLDCGDARGVTTYLGCGLEGQGFILPVTGWEMPGGPKIQKIDTCPDAAGRRQNRRWA